MKFTLWNQFSSNHSANFTLVGRFATAEWAEEVAAELRTFLQAVGAEHDETADDEYAEDDLSEELTPPEVDFQTKYQLATYYFALDWCWLETAPEDTVSVYRDVVVLQPNAETWNGPFPFMEYIEKRGGVPTYTVETDATAILFRLSATFASTEQATAVWNRIERGTDGLGSATFRVPNMPVLVGQVHLNDATILFDAVDLTWSEELVSLATLLMRLLDYLESTAPVSLEYEFYQSQPPQEPRR